MVIGIASGTTTMTIDITARDTPAAKYTTAAQQGPLTATDAFVLGASAYKTASASRIVATEIHHPSKEAAEVGGLF